jgi:hypothetical protein
VSVAAKICERPLGAGAESRNGQGWRLPTEHVL